MIRAMYTATSGMLVRGVERFDMLTNNLANVQTPGFRAFYLHQQSQPPSNGEHNSDVQVTYGQVYTDPRPGDMQATGEPMDFALRGEGYFVVQMPDGSEAYTRNGRFQRDAQGSILDASFHPIMGTSGPLRVDPNATVTMATDGTILADGKPVDKLRTVVFPEGKLPRPIGYGATAAAEDAPPTDAPVPVIQGYFERSNVNSVEELVRILELQRSTDGYQKVIQAAMEDTTGQLVRQTGRVA